MSEADHSTGQSEKVPEELIERLHEANQRFHQSREQLEKTEDGSDYRHGERVDAARDALQEVEQQVEAVEGEIAKALKKPPSQATGEPKK